MRYKKFWGIIIYFIVLVVLIIYFAACNDLFVISNPPDVNNTSVSVKNSEGLNSPLSNVIISDAKLLITEVELETGGQPEDKEITKGPFVIHIPLDGTIQTISSGAIGDGDFIKLKYNVHKPDENESIPDQEFRSGSAGNQRYSCIIRGTIDGNPFIYKSTQSMNISISLDNMIKLAKTNINLTVLLNTDKWFVLNNVTLDPRDPGNAGLIDENIKDSFNRAFKDDDKNGLPDGN